MEAMQAALREILAHVDSSHGIDHAIAVQTHCMMACIEARFIGTRESTICVIAGLLHDADDRKYHPDSFLAKYGSAADGQCNYRNARLVMDKTQVPAEIQTQVLECVSLVSYSANGDSRIWSADHPRAGQPIPEWMLYPRYADRLEASGEIGYERCCDYTKAHGGVVVHPDTPLFGTDEEIYQEVERRRGDYHRVGKSRSVIDHYYDKIVPLSLAACENLNPYFSRQFREKHLYDMGIVRNAKPLLNE